MTPEITSRRRSLCWPQARAARRSSARTTRLRAARAPRSIGDIAGCALTPCAGDASCSRAGTLRHPTRWAVSFELAPQLRHPIDVRDGLADGVHGAAARNLARAECVDLRDV